MPREHISFAPPLASEALAATYIATPYSRPRKGQEKLSGFQRFIQQYQILALIHPGVIFWEKRRCHYGFDIQAKENEVGNGEK